MTDALQAATEALYAHMVRPQDPPGLETMLRDRAARYSRIVIQAVVDNPDVRQRIGDAIEYGDDIDDTMLAVLAVLTGPAEEDAE